MKRILLTYKQPTRSAIALALPIIAGQLGQILMGFFDTIQVGGLGSVYIAACGFANTIFWTVNLLGLGIFFAISPLVSQARGEGNPWKAIGVYKSGLRLSVWLSVVFVGLSFLLSKVLYLFNQPPQVVVLSGQFLRIVALSVPFIFIYANGKGLLDGLGRTKPGMFITLGGLVLIVFLNWVLIYGHLGLPAMGMEGTAWATVIARAAQALAMMLFLRYDKQVRELREYAQQEAINQHPPAKGALAAPANTPSRMADILRIGVPAGLQFFWEIGAFSIAHIMSGWMGETTLAAHQIAINLASITFMVASGISAAGCIMTGYSFGAKDKEGIRIAANTAIGLCIAAELLFALLFLLGHNWLPRIYTDDISLLPLASSLVLLAAFFQLSDGLQNMAGNILRGIQDVTIPTIISLFCYWAVMIPACYVLGFHTGLGIRGIWVGFLIGLNITAFSLLWRFYAKLKVLKFS